VKKRKKKKYNKIKDKNFKLFVVGKIKGNIVVGICMCENIRQRNVR
jgi:hypothetical protein